MLRYKIKVFFLFEIIIYVLVGSSVYLCSDISRCQILRVGKQECFSKRPTQDKQISNLGRIGIAVLLNYSKWGNNSQTKLLKRKTDQRDLESKFIDDDSTWTGAKINGHSNPRNSRISLGKPARMWKEIKLITNFRVGLCVGLRFDVFWKW